MSAAFVYALQGEWMKKKRSLASWVVIAGSFFTPCIVIFVRLLQHDGLRERYAGAGFWTQLWRSSWESMAIFFLPIVCVLAASLVAQLEFKNNAWKQLHALPLSLPAIYFSKFAVVVLMMLQFFMLFNVAIYLSAVIPGIAIGGVAYPQAPIPFGLFLKENFLYFVDCLPIVAAQYAISVRYSNFLVPVGVGFLAWIGALAALPWKMVYLIPYSYSMLDYLKNDPSGKAAVPAFEFHWLAMAWFVFFTAAGYWFFAARPAKG